MIRLVVAKILVLTAAIFLLVAAFVYQPGGALNKHDWLQDRIDPYLDSKAAASKIEMHFMEVRFSDIMKENLCFDICLKHGELRPIPCERAKRK